MRKLKLFFACLLMAVLSIGQMWGAEEVYYTNTCPKSTSNSSYANYYDATIGGIGWKAPGNQYENNGWRIGAKASETYTRYLYTKTAIDDNITKIVVKHNAKATITVNSYRLDVYSSAALAAAGATGDVSSITQTYVDNGNTTFTRPTGHNWNNRYFRFTYSLTQSTTSARYVSLNKIDFYHEAESTCTPLAAPGSPSSTAHATSVDLSWNPVSGATGYLVIFNGTEYNVASGTTKTIDNLSPETEYHWTVAAKGNGTTNCAVGTATADQTVTTLDDCTGTKATYTVTSKTEVSSSEAPSGSSATFNNNGTNSNDQMTSGKRMLLTLSGYEGYIIKSIKLSMKSNTSSGAGNFSAVAGSTTISSISTATFSDASWNGAWSTSYVTIVPTMSNADYVIKKDEDVVITIAATANSLFCESFSICYEEAPSYTLSSAVSPAGKATVTLGATSLKEGKTTTATLSDITAGYEFVNWTISGTGASLSNNTANQTTVTMGSANATVTANLQCIAPTIETHPASKNYVKEEVATALSVGVSQTGSWLGYQWQSSSNGTDWANVGTNSTYTPSTGTAGTTYYRVIVSNSATGCNASVTSNTATIVVSDIPTCATPTFSPTAGIYHAGQSVAISCETEGASVRYTMTDDGSDPATPTAGSTAYSTPIVLSSNGTYKIKAVAIKEGANNSTVASATYTIALPRTVTLHPGSGTSDASVVEQAATYGTVTLPSATPACATDGWTFAGWATASCALTTSAPTLYNGSYDPSNGLDLYAVYSKEETSGTTEETASVTISTYATAHGWENGVQYLTVSMDANITATAAGGGNTGKYYTTGTNWRLYQGESATITISATNNCVLKSATFTYTNDNDGVLLDGSTQVASGSEHEISGDSYTFSAGNTKSATNGQVRFSAISVKYDKPTTVTYYQTAPECCTDKVTITKGDNSANGTFTIDKVGEQSTCAGAVTVIVTPTPGEHCRVDAVTASNGSVSDPDGEGNYTVTYAQNTNAASTINVTFVTKTQHKVTWNVNGDVSTKTDVYDGEKPEFPSTPTSCDDAGGSETFYGWATAPWAGKKALSEIEATIHRTADDLPAVTGAITYYAVFAKATGGGSAPNVQVMNDNGSLNSNWQDDQGRNNGIQDYAEKSSLQMYGETTTLYACELTSQIKFKNITGISMNVAANKANTVSLYYSADGTNWSTWTSTVDVAKNTEAYTDYAFDLTGFPTGSYYICLSNTVSSLYMYSVTITAESEPEYSQFMTTCCTKRTISIATGIEYGSILADLAQACEGTTVTITFTPDGGYHLKSWSVNGTAQDVAASTFLMPDEAVTVSAVFEHDPCSNLLAPTLNGAVAVTYNSATINWNAPANASSYDVTVIRHSDSESIFSGNLSALTKALSGLDPETTYDYSIMAVGDGTTYCTSGNGVLEGDFTTNALPTAHLTLIDANGTHASSGDYVVGTPFNLPTTAATCAKTFVGWDANDECVTAPTYAKGASFTFANTTGVTLHAVYADMTGGSTSTTNIAYSGSTSNMTGGNDAATFGLDAEDWNIVGAKGNNTNYPGLNTAGDIRLYSAAGGGTTITITAPQTITSVGLTFTGASYNNAYVKVGSETIALSDGVYPINATSFEIGNANTSSTSSQVRISNIAVKFTNPGTPSNYSTTCIDAPTATPDENSIEVVAAGESSTLGVTYENVNLAGVSVDICNDDQGAAFTGDWLTATIAGEDKHIEYTVQANTSYNDARTAYLKLTAPETSGAASPAVVYIEVTQAKKPAVFASLQELVAADVNANTEVTVSFSDVVIKEMYEYNYNVCGVVFNIQKAGQDIKIYFNSQTTISGWVAGGKLSGTLTNCPWKIFSGAWQLAPKSGWAWANLTYEEPAVVSSVAVSGTPTKTTYNTGEAFDPVGLTVTVTYSNALVETITANDANWAYVSWSKDPATFAAEHVGTNKSVSVTATYNAVPSSATEISGLTINKIAVSSVSLNKNAATLKTGKTLTLTATVAPENATYKTVSWKSDDTDIATVNEDGVVTAVAAGTTTITATSTDDNTKTATCELTIIESVNFNKGVWKLVTNKDELTAGSYVIFAAAGDDVAMKSYDTGNNCRGKSATKSDFLTYDSEFGVFEIGDYEISTVTYKTFQDENTNQYLFLSSNNNYLKAQDDKDETVAWTITNVSNEGVTVVTSKSQSTRTIRYNANTANPGNPLFACYTTGQADIALYKFYIKVTFEANGGSAVEPVYVEYNESVAAPAIPTKAGYRFNGWKLNSAAYDFNTKLTENITLEADWSQLYTVTYAAGEGSGDAPDAVQKVAGEAFNLAANTFTAPAGKEFDGWLCDIDAAKYAAGAEYTMTAAATTFTAQWKQITYAVTYVSAHGTAPDAENAASVTLAELTEAGWTHTGWVANVDVEVDDATVTAGTPIANGKVVVLSAATEFTAQWIEDAPTPVYEIVRSGLEAGRHYTICLKKKIIAVKGATFWNLNKRDEGATVAYLEEASLPFPAGTPYIFQATNDNEGKLEVVYEGGDVENPVSNGALRGRFTDLDQAGIDAAATAESSDIYMLKNNELRQANGRSGNTMKAYKAYIVYGDLTPVSTSPLPAPGKRVKSMPMEPQVTTDIDNVQGDNVQCTKVLIDGQMYILRGEKLYDATGRLVK